MNPHAQAIIGTEKKNQHYTVFRDTKKKQISVYFGMGLLETIPDQKGHPQLKLLAARLFLNGVSSKTLHSAFGYCYRTIKGTADAMQSGDIEELNRLLEGVHSRRKLTKDIEGYVRHRFKSVYPENKRNYSQILRTEIKEIFSKEISGECLRPLFRELKKEFEENPSSQKKTLK